MNKNVVIIGGGGFIGSHLATLMTKFGYDVSVVDIAFDVTRLERNQYTVATHEILERSDIIVHLASILGVSNVELNPMNTIDVTYNTVKDIIPYCTSNRRVIYASTSEVYGDSPNPMYETDPIQLDNITNVRSAYKLSKLLAENMITQNGGIVIRPFNVTGYGQDVEKAVIPKMINEAVYGGIIKVYNDGSQVRAFMDIDDAVSAILYIIQTDNPESIYNIGNPNNAISMMELAKLIQTRVPTADIIQIPFNDVHPKSFEIYNRIPNVDRLNIPHTYNLELIITKVLTWMTC